jgi:Protein of unknown function (DUF2423)
LLSKKKKSTNINQNQSQPTAEMRSKRSSRVKFNKSILRDKVFGPVVDERTARLNAKLKATAASAKPERDTAMVDVESEQKKKGTEQEESEGKCVVYCVPQDSMTWASSSTSSGCDSDLTDGSECSVEELQEERDIMKSSFLCKSFGVDECNTEIASFFGKDGIPIFAAYTEMPDEPDDQLLILLGLCGGNVRFW